MTQATGGVVSYYIRNNVVYKVHTFLTSGNLVVSEAGSIDVLAIAGGGGGGGRHGGGGGAGGYQYTTANAAVTTYAVVVGSGGTGAQTDTAGGDGGNTTVIGLTSIGGGGGGSYGGAGYPAGRLGGSGGGAGHAPSAPGNGTPGQGNGGGSSNGNEGGGGGGAGAAGGSASSEVAGNGGIGLQNAILGTNYYWAGGGGGGIWDAGGGGNDRGGNGGLGGGGGGGYGAPSGLFTFGRGGGSALNSGESGIAATSGAVSGGAGGANTGGGGGGSGQRDTSGYSGVGGNGGSGIVVARYTITPTGFTAVQNSSTLTLNKFITNISTAPVSGNGGSFVYTYTISPALPSGLSINSSTGAILGQPRTAVTNVTYTVTINDGFTSVSNTFSLTTTINLANVVVATGGTTALYYNSTRDTIYRAHTFTSSGNLVVSTGGPLQITAWGGGGGGGSTSGSGAGGAGAFVQGEFTSTATSYGVVVGGGGDSRGANAGTGTAPSGGGGLPGNAGYGGQGGGYSGFFSSTTISQANAVLIAAGGGGGSWEGRNGGAGGITQGVAGGAGTSAGGGGGTQSAGGTSVSGAGSALQGGNAGSHSDTGGAGGGGGGYFGGGAGGNDSTGSAGGGGSSYIANTLTSVVSEAGSGTTPGGTTNALYRGWGIGGASGSNVGTAGVVVVAYPIFPTSINLTVDTPNVTLNQYTVNSGVTPVSVASGGVSPYYYSISPALPTGLHFSTTTGQITGQPTVTTSATVYTVTVRDSTITLVGAPVNSSTANFTLTTTTTFPANISVTGGTVSNIAVSGLTYRVHTFTTSANLVLNQTTTLEYLMVAGGGGGGGRHGGGGGGGGFVASIVALPAGTYPVIIGAGGSGAQTDTQGNDGGDSGLIQSSVHGSGEFDGRSSYIQLANSTALTLNTGAWTAECWINPTGDYSIYRTIFAKRVSGSSSTAYEGYLRIGSGVVSYYNGTNYESSTTLTPRVWSHVAWVHNGTNIRIFVNGVTVLNVAAATNEVNEPLVIGGARGNNEWFHGYMSSFRIVKGTALYTADFTPPTAPLTAISGTSLLTLQHPTVWVDSSTNAAAITTSGTPVQSPFNPFNNLDASGGGGGGSYSGNSPTPGRVGGSGGGGGTSGAAGGAAWVGQGNSGGQGNNDEGGGGGGAGAAGQAGVGSVSAGAGGAGAISNIDGLNYYYAGGGGGGSWEQTPGNGGLGGGGGGGGGNTTAFGTGGTGGRNPGTAGIAGYSGAVNGGTGGANTGSGGGSSGQRDYQSYTGVGGNGGSGIVIVRYITGGATLTTTRNTSKVLFGKYNNTPQIPVSPVGGTGPFTYSISPSLPEGVLFSTANGAVYGSPTVAVYDASYTVTITDSSVTPATATNTFTLSTSLSYQYAVDLVANKLLKITTEYGVDDSERRSASISSPGTQIIVNANVANNKSLYYGNVYTITSTPGFVTNISTVTLENPVVVSSTFNNYVNVGGNLKTYYGNIVANVSGFFLSNAFYGNTGTYTWTVPAGVTSISVAAVGGGGGGSQRATGGSGGSGGQLKFVNNIAVTPGDTYTIVVGAGGQTALSYGNSGGDTYMYKTGNTVPILLAAGGSGGDSMYWSDTTSSVTVYDTPNSATFYTFTAVNPAGGNVTYSVSSGSLPSGVTLNSSTGVLGGDPAQEVNTTNYPFTVAATNGTQTITKSFTLTVVPLPPGQITISPAISGVTYWNFLEAGKGNLSITSANVSYTITTTQSFQVEMKLWGGGGGGAGSGYIGGGGGYSTGRFTLQPGVSYTIIVGEGGGGTTSGRAAGGGGAGTGMQFTSNSTPIIVAGGGGGGAGGAGRGGGGGGGTTGGSVGSGGAGGTQSAAGAGGNGGRRTGASGSGRNGGYGNTGSAATRFAYGFGTGGWGSYNGGDAGSGGGGGGYWGGGEGGGDAGGFGGGGGSGYLHPTLITSGTTTAGGEGTVANSSDSVRGTAGNPTTGTGNGQDGTSYSGFNGLFWIRKI